MSGAYTLGTTDVADTFAEAFPMRFARLVITAVSEDWALERRGSPPR
jgi:formylmethanofuran:tetrahydromethanopterin formyltransferase